MTEAFTAVKAAKIGNEQPFDIFFKSTFAALQKQLIFLTKSEYDAKTIYLEAMQRFWDRFVVGIKELPKNPKAYIFIICKNVWFMQKRDPWNKVLLYESSIETSQNKYQDIQETEELELRKLRERSFELGLNQLGQKCKELLRLNMDASVKLIDFQEKLGYKTYQAMIQAKYNCKKKLVIEVSKVVRKLKKTEYDN